jgi:hypothetical protein
MTETKEARNARVQARYDELMHEGKHGHYETLFRVVAEELGREREACAKLFEKEGRVGHISFELAAETIRARGKS